LDSASEALDSTPVSCIPPFRELSELPTLHVADQLAIDLDLAANTRAPTSGRLALVAVVVHAELENVMEIASVPVPSLPGVVTLDLPPMPQEIIDLQAAANEAFLRSVGWHTLDPAPVQIHTYLAVYDDANGNGTMETGQDFSAWHGFDAEERPGAAEGGSTLDRTPNFTGWSSPTDPNNEVIHITRVQAVFSEETGGYHFSPIGDACRPTELVDPTTGFTTVVRWSLPES
jgi:hypothetical protein